MVQQRTVVIFLSSNRMFLRLVVSVYTRVLCRGRCETSAIRKFVKVTPARKSSASPQNNSPQDLYCSIAWHFSFSLAGRAVSSTTSEISPVAKAQNLNSLGARDKVVDIKYSRPTLFVSIISKHVLVLESAALVSSGRSNPECEGAVSTINNQTSHTCSILVHSWTTALFPPLYD